MIWEHEVGGLSEGVIGPIERKLGLDFIEEIDLSRFFSFSSVAVKDDVIQFPMGSFYSCKEANLLVYRGHSSSREPYEFLTAVLDFAIDRCEVKDLYVAGGVVTSIAHTSPRRVFGIVNKPEIKQVLEKCGVHTGMDYQTPQGGGTSLSNYLLWVAMTRNLAGCTLWVEVPFYLAAIQDPMASKHVLWVLEERFGLDLDYDQIDVEIRKVNSDIDELKSQNTDIHRYLEMMERGIMLNDTEGEALAKEIARFFSVKKRDS